VIGLSDGELAVITALAGPLPPNRRSAFLEAVIAEAATHAVIGPGLISRIGRERQRAFLGANRMPSMHEPGGMTRQHATRAGDRRAGTRKRFFPNLVAVV
jgi:hypothetical protein